MPAPRAIASGFTLIELVVTLSIAAILAALAAPSFTETWRQQRLSRQMTGFVNAHRLARSEAASRGRIVTVCKSADATTSAPSCGDDTVEWEDGWIVFQNTDGDLPPELDPGEPILRVAAALDRTLTLRGDAAVDASVSYRPVGDVLAPGMLVLCDDGRLSHARALLVSTSGRVRTTDRDENGTPLDRDENAIDSCQPA